MKRHPDLDNPVRYKSRYELYRRFKDEIDRHGARVVTAEMAFGDRPFEVSDARQRDMRDDIRAYFRSRLEDSTDLE